MPERGRHLPKDFPPRSTVREYFDLWSYDGTPGRIQETRHAELRTRDGRTVEPSAAIVDGESAFPDSRWIKLGTSSPLERIMRETGHRTRVAGAFPDGKSCLDPAAARLRPVAGTRRATRKCMNTTPLFAVQTQGAAAA